MMDTVIGQRAFYVKNRTYMFCWREICSQIDIGSILEIICLSKQMKYICFINILTYFEFEFCLSHMLALCLIKWSTLYPNPVILVT